MVLANQRKVDIIFPLTVKEIEQAQKDVSVLKKLHKHDRYSTQLEEDTQLLHKDGKIITPKVLQSQAVSWYHHYLQHPRHTRLKKTLHKATYWKGMRHNI
jgi:hypothetical protein